MTADAVLNLAMEDEPKYEAKERAVPYGTPAWRRLQRKKRERARRMESI